MPTASRSLSGRLRGRRRRCLARGKRVNIRNTLPVLMIAEAAHQQVRHLFRIPCSSPRNIFDCLGGEGEMPAAAESKEEAKVGQSNTASSRRNGAAKALPPKAWGQSKPAVRAAQSSMPLVKEEPVPRYKAGYWAPSRKPKAFDAAAVQWPGLTDAHTHRVCGRPRGARSSQYRASLQEICAVKAGNRCTRPEARGLGVVLPQSSRLSKMKAPWRRLQRLSRFRGPGGLCVGLLA